MGSAVGCGVSVGVGVEATGLGGSVGVWDAAGLAQETNSKDVKIVMVKSVVLITFSPRGSGDRLSQRPQIPFALQQIDVISSELVPAARRGGKGFRFLLGDP